MQILKVCDYCGKEFYARQSNQRWCSKACSDKGHTRERDNTKKTKVCKKIVCYNYDQSKESNCIYFDDARKCKLK